MRFTKLSLIQLTRRHLFLFKAVFRFDGTDLGQPKNMEAKKKIPDEIMDQMHGEFLACVEIS